MLRFSVIRSSSVIQSVFISLFASIITIGISVHADVTVDATTSEGKTTCALFLIQTTIPEMKSESKKKFTVADRATVKTHLDQFDKSVVQKDFRPFRDGEESLYKLVDALAGQEFTPMTFAAAIDKKLEELDFAADKTKIGLDGVILAPFLGIISGAGVRVQWILKDESIEYGAKFEGPLAQMVKSIRGFGRDGDRGLLDASDVNLLSRAGSVLAGKEESAEFYEVLFDILTQMKVSGIKRLPSEEQALMIDFLTVYSAEFTRGYMTGFNDDGDFKSHPWEKDLAEAFFLATFVNKAKTIVKDGKPSEGSLKDFFGVGLKGSGIGETRTDRRKLQLAITKFERKNSAKNNDLIGRIERLILGDKAGSDENFDVYSGVMKYLNNKNTQVDVQKNSAEISKLMIEFLGQVSEDASDIAASLKDTLPAPSVKAAKKRAPKTKAKTKT